MSTRTCRICKDPLSRSATEVCAQCLREHDNQILEDALAMPRGFLELEGQHTVGCRRNIDADLECNCGAGDLTPEVLRFNEAENY
jgi:hypothetical protein